MIRTYKKGKATKLSANFKSTEFDCHGQNCCSETKVDDQLITYLQKIRDHFSKSVTISSGYRCETHNRSVGGATASRHAKGMAADIIVKGVAPAEVAKYAESIGILGIGLYETNADGHFVHIDTRTAKSFWYGQKQVRRNTFGGAAVASDKPNVNKTIMAWQEAAIQDGFSLPSGADGIWGKECETIARVALCRNRGPGNSYKYINLTKFVQKKVGVKSDGLFGANTDNAVKAYQKKVGLPQTGATDGNTWKKILEII